MPKIIDTVVWDADNTLWDWISMHLAGMRVMSEKISRITGFPPDKVRDSMARVYGQAGTFDYKPLVQEMDVIEEWAGSLSPEREKIRRVIDLTFSVHEAYTQKRCETFRMYPDVPTVLSELNNAGVKNVIVSDAPISKILRRVKLFNIDPYFSQICGRPAPMAEEERQKGVSNLIHYENELTKGGAYNTDARITVMTEEKKPFVNLTKLLRRTNQQTAEGMVMVGDNFEKDIGTASHNGCHGLFARYGGAVVDSLHGLHEFAPPHVVTRNAAGIDLSKDNLQAIRDMGDKIQIVDSVRDVLDFVLTHNKRK